MYLLTQSNGKKKSYVRWIVFLIVALAIVGSAVMVFINQKEKSVSPEKTVELFVKAMEDQDTEKVIEMVVPENDKMEIDKTTVNAFIKYFHASPKKVKKLIQHLNDQIEQDDYGVDDDYLVNIEKVDDKYALIVSPVYFQVKTNYKDLVITMDGKEIAESDRDDYSEELGPFLPGWYEFEAINKTEYVTLKQTFDQKPSLKANDSLMVTLYVDIPTVSFFSLNAGLEEYKLFLNGKDTGEIMKKDDHRFGQLPIDGSITAYLEGDFPWGTMKSEEIDVEKPNNSSIPFTADKELEQTLKDIIIQYNRHREETISEADESNLPEATESMAESIAQIGKDFNNEGKTYQTNFIGLDFYPSTFVLDGTGSKKRDFKFIIVTNTIAEEAVYQEDDQNVEMDDVNILLAYEVVYDEHSDEWKVNAIGDEDIIESRYGDLSDEEVAEYRE